MKYVHLLLLVSSMILFSGCDIVLSVLENTASDADPTPTQTEIIQGLKQALAEGTARAITGLSAEGGYGNDPTVFIPFPPEAQFAADKLQQLGLGSLIDRFVARLNEGAERGAKEAGPIFKDAILAMTFADARGILLGQDQHAATAYFERTTRTALYNTFSPKIEQVLSQVHAVEIWQQLTSRYNSIPLVRKKVETDIVKYATNKALDGLFLKLSQEEENIRQDPFARTTNLLKKVFEYAARHNR